MFIDFQKGYVHAIQIACCAAGHRAGTGPDRLRDPHYAMRAVFTDHDRRLIHDYYAPRYQKLPPGQVKKGTASPPSHAWRVSLNQPIHEVAQLRYLPYALDQRLSRLPPEYVRVIIGTDVVIMNTRTRVVVDILQDIAD
jgi:hypothetical protein